MGQGLINKHAPLLLTLPKPNAKEQAIADSKTAQQRELQRWESRATNSKSLQKLLQMVGLQAIKRECFSLCDQVRIYVRGISNSRTYLQQDLSFRGTLNIIPARALHAMRGRGKRSNLRAITYGSWPISRLLKGEHEESDWGRDIGT
jgi:hypothetical protein